MSERSIIEAAARLRRRGEPHLIATVVAVRGSAYRRPGARMLLTQFRWIAGSVSGGCLEGDISSKGWWRTRDGEPVIVTYDARIPDEADDDDVRAAFGLGCDGLVEVLLERAGTPGRIDPLELAGRCLAEQRRGAVVTVIRAGAPGIAVGHRLALVRGEAAIADPALGGVLRERMRADAEDAIERGVSCNRSYDVDGGTVSAFVEAIVPPPRLFVFGTGHDVVPVTRLARAIGWDVSVCTPRPRVAIRERFAGDEVLVGAPGDFAARIAECDRAMAVVMSHNYELDRDHLGMLAGSRAHYVGVLGPRGRTARMLSELCLGTPLDDPRVHAPIGLELGAETPEEIALAIVAEIQAVLRRMPAGSLRDRVGPIHDRPAAA
jgi:xanthine/CO dehydrogenase XdhC/CoxF family maturation factor